MQTVLKIYKGNVLLLDSHLLFTIISCFLKGAVYMTFKLNFSHKFDYKMIKKILILDTFAVF